jgi:hypothetical protein
LCVTALGFFGGEFLGLCVHQAKDVFDGVAPTGAITDVHGVDLLQG